MECNYKLYKVALKTTSDNSILEQSFKIYANNKNKIKNIVKLIMPDYNEILIEEIDLSKAECYYPNKVTDVSEITITENSTPSTDKNIYVRPDSVPSNALWPIYKNVYVAPENRTEGVRYNTLDSYDNLLTGNLNRSFTAARRSFKMLSISPDVTGQVDDTDQYFYLIEEDLFEDLPEFVRLIENPLYYAWLHPERWIPIFDLLLSSEEFENWLLYLRTNYIKMNSDTMKYGEQTLQKDKHTFYTKRRDFHSIKLEWDSLEYTENFENISKKTANRIKSYSRWMYDKVGKYRMKYDNEDYIVVTSIHDIKPTDYIDYDSPEIVAEGHSNKNYLQDPTRHNFELIICVRKAKENEI